MADKRAKARAHARTQKLLIKPLDSKEMAQQNWWKNRIGKLWVRDVIKPKTKHNETEHWMNGLRERKRDRERTNREITICKHMQNVSELKWQSQNIRFKYIRRRRQIFIYAKCTNTIAQFFVRDLPFTLHSL